MREKINPFSFYTRMYSNVKLCLPKSYVKEKENMQNSEPFCLCTNSICHFPNEFMLKIN